MVSSSGENADHGPDVFVHVPKTAGTSLRSAVLDHYGSDNVWIYRESSQALFPFNAPSLDARNGKTSPLKHIVDRMPMPVVKALLHVRRLGSSPPEAAFQRATAIIGHFSIDKYSEYTEGEDVRVFTVVREPLERMVSHYRYAQQYRNTRTMGWLQGSNPDLSFGQFALGENVQDFQTRYTGTDPNRYDLVGTTENLTGFLRVTGLIDEKAEAPQLRKTTAPMPDAAPLDDSGFQRDFAEFHAADYAFYAAALDGVKAYQG